MECPQYGPSVQHDMMGRLPADCQRFFGGIVAYRNVWGLSQSGTPLDISGDHPDAWTHRPQYGRHSGSTLGGAVRWLSRGERRFAYHYLPYERQLRAWGGRVAGGDPARTGGFQTPADQ